MEDGSQDVEIHFKGDSETLRLPLTEGDLQRLAHTLHDLRPLERQIFAFYPHASDVGVIIALDRILSVESTAGLYEGMPPHIHRYSPHMRLAGRSHPLSFDGMEDWVFEEFVDELGASGVDRAILWPTCYDGDRMGRHQLVARSEVLYIVVPPEWLELTFHLPRRENMDSEIWDYDARQRELYAKLGARPPNT